MFVIKKSAIVVVLATVLLGGGIYVFWSTKNDDPDTLPPAPFITSYEECVAAGNPVLMSYPPQCSADGQTFTQATTDESAPSTEYTSLKGIKIYVTEPLTGSVVKSPLVVKGSVPGNWSFEATFPVSILDPTGITVAQIPAQLQGDWMTDALVPFEATLVFDNRVGGGEAMLVLKKDNPSGHPENDDSVSIPINF